jgi:hypothetical protein
MTQAQECLARLGALADPAAPDGRPGPAV